MKKVDLEKQIAKLAKVHEVSWINVGGTKHDKFKLNGVTIMIPRHTEITEALCKKILKDCAKAIEGK